MWGPSDLQRALLCLCRMPHGVGQGSQQSPELAWDAGKGAREDRVWETLGQVRLPTQPLTHEPFKSWMCQHSPSLKQHLMTSGSLRGQSMSAIFQMLSLAGGRDVGPTQSHAAAIAEPSLAPQRCLHMRIALSLTSNGDQSRPRRGRLGTQEFWVGSSRGNVKCLHFMLRFVLH